ncbi:hypothetical protein GQ42DRAFT_146746 [Ramicandelaber brevisporus]|nr:hypothetical protein GQ42DRAFT_146746 [Ramicandelaber brevisporus]
MTFFDQLLQIRQPWQLWPAATAATVAPSDDCHVSRPPLELAIAASLCVGTALSYLPQHLRIIRLASSDGLSPYFVLLGTLGAFSNAVNIVILQWHVIQCCFSVLSAGRCLAGSLSILQLVGQWAAVFGVFVLYELYFPEYRRYVRVMPAAHVPPNNSTTLVRTAEWSMALQVIGIIAAHMVLVTYLALYYSLSDPIAGPGGWRARTFASSLGLFSTIVTCIQYIPQIQETWRRQTVGALSIPMMMLQTPGGFAIAYTIARQPGTNMSSWASTFVAAILQGTLLTICIGFHLRDKRRAQTIGPILQTQESRIIAAASTDGDGSNGNDRSSLRDEIISASENGYPEVVHIPDDSDTEDGTEHDQLLVKPTKKPITADPPPPYPSN